MSNPSSEGWTKHSTELGVPFWYNKISKRSSWTPPPPPAYGLIPSPLSSRLGTNGDRIEIHFTSPVAGEPLGLNCFFTMLHAQAEATSAFGSEGRTGSQG
eukprot:1340568-Amorphochlora_amoeboformis.AAC.2